MAVKDERSWEVARRREKSDGALKINVNYYKLVLDIFCWY